MNINKTCNLFLRDLYSYDISSCHYSILHKFGFDLSKINKEDKISRNIQIGKMMAENPRITNLLRSTTESVINEYLNRNQVSSDELIVRQYDGIISKKLLKDTTNFLSLELRDTFQVFIISIDRTRYITTNGSNTVIKGVSHRYEKIDNIFEKMLRINFSNKSSVFKELEKIKHEILFSENPLLYCIPTTESMFNVVLKEYGLMEVSSTVTKILDTNDIDREWYFNNYVRPFTESITIEFL